jgi:hypothetical protein
MGAAVPARALIAVAVACVALAPSAAGGPVGAASAVPVLAPWSAPYAERDMPRSVQERNLREQRALAALAQEAMRLPATRENGCVGSNPGYPLGPPSPRVTPRVLGHHVEVLFELARMPESPACRPWLVSVALLSGNGKSWSERFRLNGPSGRVALNLPFAGLPPYRVLVQSQTLGGRMGKTVELTASCPGTGHAVKGCLRGLQPALHSTPMPKPVLPLRALDRRTLEASLAQVLADDARPPVVGAIPRASRCLSLRICEVTYADPLFPRSPYRVYYSIAGQQVRGCWIGRNQFRTSGRLPYEDAGHGRLFLAGCASWLG